MGLFAFRPLSEKQKEDNPLRPLRLCGELLPIFKGKMKLKDNHKSFSPALAGRRWFYVELPAMEYSEAWNLQCQLVASRKDRIIDTDIVLCLEHPPVFTLGRRG